MAEKLINAIQADDSNSQKQNPSLDSFSKSLPDLVGWRPRVLFRLDNHVLHLIDCINGRRLLIKHATEAHDYICELLRKSISVHALTQHVRKRFPRMTTESVHKFLSILHDRGLVESRSIAMETNLTSTDLTRYDRQLRYLGFFENPSADRYQMQSRLKNATVTIIGLGGVGNWVAWHLAAMGIGHLVLADHDRVELSNLNRQPLYSEKEIGQLKVDIGARRLKTFNPELSVEPIRLRISSPEDVEKVIRQSSILVLTADQPRVLLRQWVNLACIRQKMPYIQGSLDAYLLQIGPLYRPYSTGCYACRETQRREDNPKLNDMQVKAYMEATRQFPPLLGPLCGFVGANIALDVVRFIAGYETPVTEGKYYLVDARKWSTRTIFVERVENCPVCGGAQGS